MNNKDAYKFSNYTNIKAIIDFLEQTGKTEKDINLYEVWLLSYLVTLYTKDNTLTKKIISGKKYVFIADTLIIDNLKFSPKTRQIKNVIRKLETLGFITRHIQDKKKRFISINEMLLKLWKVENWTMNAVSYLMKYEPEKYDSISNNFKPKLKNYSDLIDRFNNNYDMEGKGFDTSQINKQLFFYLQECSKNGNGPDRSNKYKNQY